MPLRKRMNIPFTLKWHMILVQYSREIVLVKLGELSLFLTLSPLNVINAISLISFSRIRHIKYKIYMFLIDTFYF